MAIPTLVLFDDDIARRWEPFALTRPAGELIFGVMTLRARMEQVVGVPCSGHLGAPHLAGFREAGAPPVLQGTAEAGSGDRLFLLSRFVPSWGAFPVNGLAGGAIRTTDGATVGWYCPAGTPPPDPDSLLHPDRTPDGTAFTVPGRTLGRVWEVLTEGFEQIARDIRFLYDRPSRPRLPDGSHHLGNGPLIIDSTAAIEPGTVFDTTGGPILIARSAKVKAFTRLAGPAYVGPGSTILGGALEAISIGPVCRIRGEFAESVALGYVNKQHDGHIGHAYLGRWVNLGAETTNSDLKNNYGTIRLWTPDGEIDTGEIKLGSLIGDHVKTGIGLLLTTGTVVGAGSNIFGAAMPPTYVPPFSWGEGRNLSEYRLDKFLEVVERAMGRRDVELEESHRAQLTAAWQLAAHVRAPEG